MIFRSLVLLLFFISCQNNGNNKPIDNFSNNLNSECKIFLEDYESEVLNYLSIQSKISDSQNDINLIMERNSAEESVKSMQSDPGLFKCISNSKFKATIDSLNALMD
tara:strand:+ start:9656 stop:9976 length:321 start_codon:yes stop_codon:yes gene_type:complete